MGLRFTEQPTTAVYEFERMTDDEMDDIFYTDDEIGDMRHAAFMIDVGLQEEDEGQDVEPVPWPKEVDRRRIENFESNLVRQKEERRQHYENLLASGNIASTHVEPIYKFLHDLPQQDRQEAEPPPTPEIISATTRTPITANRKKSIPEIVKDEVMDTPGASEPEPEPTPEIIPATTKTPFVNVMESAEPEVQHEVVESTQLEIQDEVDTAEPALAPQSTPEIGPAATTTTMSDNLEESKPDIPQDADSDIPESPSGPEPQLTPEIASPSLASSSLMESSKPDTIIQDETDIATVPHASDVEPTTGTMALKDEAHQPPKKVAKVTRRSLAAKEEPIRAPTEDIWWMDAERSKRRERVVFPGQSKAQSGGAAKEEEEAVRMEAASANQEEPVKIKPPPGAVNQKVVPNENETPSEDLWFVDMEKSVRRERLKPVMMRAAEDDSIASLSKSMDGTISLDDIATLEDESLVEQLVEPIQEEEGEQELKDDEEKTSEIWWMEAEKSKRELVIFPHAGKSETKDASIAAEPEVEEEPLVYEDTMIPLAGEPTSKSCRPQRWNSIDDSSMDASIDASMDDANTIDDDAELLQFEPQAKEGATKTKEEEGKPAEPDEGEEELKGEKDKTSEEIWWMEAEKSKREKVVFPHAGKRKTGHIKETQEQVEDAAAESVNEGAAQGPIDSTMQESIDDAASMDAAELLMPEAGEEELKSESKTDNDDKASDIWWMDAEKSKREIVVFPRAGKAEKKAQAKTKVKPANVEATKDDGVDETDTQPEPSEPSKVKTATETFEMHPAKISEEEAVVAPEKVKANVSKRRSSIEEYLKKSAASSHSDTTESTSSMNDSQSNVASMASATGAVTPPRPSIDENVSPEEQEASSVPKCQAVGLVRASKSTSSMLSDMKHPTSNKAQITGASPMVNALVSPIGRRRKRASEPSYRRSLAVANLDSTVHTETPTDEALKKSTRPVYKKTHSASDLNIVENQQVNTVQTRTVERKLMRTHSGSVTKKRKRRKGKKKGGAETIQEVDGIPSGKSPLVISRRKSKGGGLNESEHSESGVKSNRRSNSKSKRSSSLKKKKRPTSKPRSQRKSKVQEVQKMDSDDLSMKQLSVELSTTKYESDSLQGSGKTWNSRELSFHPPNENIVDQPPVTKDESSWSHLSVDDVPLFDPNDIVEKIEPSKRATRETIAGAPKVDGKHELSKLESSVSDISVDLPSEVAPKQFQPENSFSEFGEELSNRDGDDYPAVLKKQNNSKRLSFFASPKKFVSPRSFKSPNTLSKRLSKSITSVIKNSLDVSAHRKGKKKKKEAHHPVADSLTFIDLPIHLKQNVALFLPVDDVMNLVATSKSMKSDLNFGLVSSPLTDVASQNQTYLTGLRTKCIGVIVPNAEAKLHSARFTCDVAVGPQPFGRVWITEQDLPEYQDPRDLERLPFHVNRVVSRSPSLDADIEVIDLAFSIRPEKLYQIFVRCRMELHMDNMTVHRVGFPAKENDFMSYQFDAMLNS